MDCRPHQAFLSLCSTYAGRTRLVVYAVCPFSTGVEFPSPREPDSKENQIDAGRFLLYNYDNDLHINSGEVAR